MEMETIVESRTDFIDGLGSNDVASALRAGMLCSGHKVETIHGVPYLITPDGADVMRMEDALPNPVRIKTHRAFEEPDSFVAYVKDFKDGNTRLYGDPDAFHISAVFDDDQRGDPKWGDHRAQLQLKLSPEWNQWMEACKESLLQRDLADFFDEHLEQIAEPDASELLSDIRSVHVSSNSKFASAQMEGGDIAFTYNTETTAGATTSRGKVPSRLTLLIAPFRSWEPVQMTVTLTFHFSKEKELMFVLRAHKSDQLVNASFNDVRNHIQAAAGLPVLI